MHFVTSLVGKDNGTFKPSAEDCRDFIDGKIVTENLLTIYTELYYRIVFCGKSTRKCCLNQHASSRKTNTCHGKMIRKR
nr:MAG TPA: hypothetical protein [Caudoviricetes sp.]